MEAIEAQAPYWNVLRVHTHKEPEVQEFLNREGVPTFAAIAKERRRHSHNAVIVERALFPGYVFIRPLEPGQLEVLHHARYVYDILRFDGRNAVVDEEVIDNVRLMAESDAPLEKMDGIAVGRRVRVAWGALTDLQGIVQEIKNSLRVAVNVNLFARAVVVTVDRDMVEAI